MALRFYASVVKELKLKVRNFWGLIHTFLKVAGEKLVEKLGGISPIRNRVNILKKALSQCLNPVTIYLFKVAIEALEKDVKYVQG